MFYHCLACIVHKFGHLSIRLSWMENKFVINSGYGSGTLRLRRIISLLLEEKNLKTVCGLAGIVHNSQGIGERWAIFMPQFGGLILLSSGAKGDRVPGH